MLKADPEGATAFAAAAGINTNAKKLMSVRENDDGTVTKYYTDGSEEQIKYLEMDMTGIRVAHYYTELPRPEQLQEIIQRQIKCSQSESK